MPITFNSNREPIRCYACPLTIPPFETYIATDNRAFCLPCVQRILDNGTVAEWQAAVSERAKVLQAGPFETDGDWSQYFCLHNYEKNQKLIEVSYATSVFEMECQNKIGLPIVVTFKEKERVEHLEVLMESDG